MIAFHPLVRAIAAIAIALYLAACLLLYFCQARLLFPGAFMPLPPGIEAIGAGSGLEAAAIAAADSAKLFALQREPLAGRPVIIVFHGNGSYPESYRFLYGGWIAAGYGVVAPAARGYPRSEGAPEGEKMLADALAIYDNTAKTFPGHPIYVFGQSLGTAVAIHLAARRPVAGIVLVSPFASMLSLVQGKLPILPISWLLKSPFRSDLDIGDVTAPILILHGSEDELVPIASARTLAAMARHDVQFETIPNAGHARGLFQLDMIDRIDRFLGLDSQ